MFQSCDAIIIHTILMEEWDIFYKIAIFYIDFLQIKAIDLQYNINFKTNLNRTLYYNIITHYFKLFLLIKYFKTYIGIRKCQELLF